MVPYVRLGSIWEFSLNYVAAKVSYAGYDPVFVSVARSILGGLCVLGWCRLRGIKLFEADRTLIAGVAVGLLFGVEFLFLYIGLEYTTVARNTLLVNTMPPPVTSSRRRRLPCSSLPNERFGLTART